MKTRVAMLFGGKSVEHEVSVISGIQAVMSMDTDKYEVIPVYMTKRNEMYIGEEIGKIESYKNIEDYSGARETFCRRQALAPLHHTFLHILSTKTYVACNIYSYRQKIFL